MSFTDDELRRAAKALATIEAEGNPEELAYFIRERTKEAPGMTLNDQLITSAVATRLKHLLKVSADDATRAAEEVFAKTRERAIYEAILDYEWELTSAPWLPSKQRHEPAGTPAPRPATHRPATQRPASRPAPIRIVRETETEQCPI